MSQALLLFLIEGATEIELAAWEHLKEQVEEQGVLALEAKSKVDLEREHQRLVEEGWELIRFGNGVFMRVSSYSRKKEKEEEKEE